MASKPHKNRALTHPRTFKGNPIPTTGKQKLLIDTYIKTRSIKKSAKIAGYASIKQAYEIYHKYKEYVDEVIDNISDVAIADVREVAYRLTNTIQADLNDFIGNDGKWNLKAIKDSQDAIKDITFDDKGNIIKVTLFNKLDSIKQLSTLLGYDKPQKVDVAVEHVYNFITTQTNKAIENGEEDIIDG